MFDLCSDGYIQNTGTATPAWQAALGNDIDSGRHVAVVNQAFARAYFEAKTSRAKIKFNAFDEIPETPHDAYSRSLASSQISETGADRTAGTRGVSPVLNLRVGHRVILAKTAVDPKSLLPSVQREIWTVDSNAAVASSGSVKDLLAEGSR